MTPRYMDVAVAFFKGEVETLKRQLTARPMSFVHAPTDPMGRMGIRSVDLRKALGNLLRDVVKASLPDHHPHVHQRFDVVDLLRHEPETDRWGDCLRVFIDTYRGHVDLRAVCPLDGEAIYRTPTSLALACALTGHADLIRIATEEPFGLHDPYELQSLIAAHEVDEVVKRSILESANLRIAHQRPEYRFEESTCTAIAVGCTELVAWFQSKGVDLTKRLLYGISTEYERAADGCVRLETGRLVKHWAFPFHKVRDVKTARALLKLGADPHAKEIGVSGGGSGLYSAIGEGGRELLRWYVEKQGASLTQRDDDGCTPLLHACSTGGVNEVKYLLARGSDPFAKSAKGENALMCSLTGAGAGSTQKLRLLLDLGVPMFDGNLSGEFISSRLRSDGDRMLVTSEVERLTRGGQQAPEEFVDALVAHLVLRHDGPSVYRLVDCGAFKGGAAEPGKNNVLHLMAQYSVRGDFGQIDASLAGKDPAVAIAQRLASFGMPVDVRNERGYTPLMEAVAHRRVEYVRALLDLGADPDAKTPGGRSALRLSRTERVQRAIRAEVTARKIESALSEPQDESVAVKPSGVSAFGMSAIL